MTVTCFTGTRSNSSKHFQLQIRAYQNVSLILAILDYWRLLHIWLDSTMTEFTGRLHLKLRILTWISDDNGDVIVTVDSEGGVSFALPATVDNVVSFMRGMKLRYNDGNGTHDIVTFLDIDYVDDMQMVCLI